MSYCLSGGEKLRGGGPNDLRDGLLRGCVEQGDVDIRSQGELLDVQLQIERLRGQQRIIVRLLSTPNKFRRAHAMDKKRWVAILRAAGLDDDAMHRWHIEFESMAPDAHREFLESLGLSRAEVARIRRWSRRGRLPRPFTRSFTRDRDAVSSYQKRTLPTTSTPPSDADE